MCRVLSDSSFFYRCQVTALLNSCQNKFRLFYQFTWRKKSVGSAQTEEVYFRFNFYKTLNLLVVCLLFIQLFCKYGLFFDILCLLFFTFFSNISWSKTGTSFFVGREDENMSRWIGLILRTAYCLDKWGFITPQGF